MKKAYVVAEVRVTDPAAYKEYLALSATTVEQYGGRFIVRGGQRDQRERGNAAHSDAWRTVIIESPSLDQAAGWYDSIEYAKAKMIRHANSIGRLFIVEGI
jgi:uncharacterized protein (DUF1330 family)